MYRGVVGARKWEREDGGACWGVECGRAVGECECEWVARVPWESVGAWHAHGERGRVCVCGGVWDFGVRWGSVSGRYVCRGRGCECMARAGWKRESVRARWSVECGRAVCEWGVAWESVGAWRARGRRG